MSDTKRVPVAKLELHWVAVADRRGRTHLEARWLPAGATSATAPAA